MIGTYGFPLLCACQRRYDWETVRAEGCEIDVRRGKPVVPKGNT